MSIAALFVMSGGPYFGIEGVDPWDELRDARAYSGPHPVVAHPPCKRWGRYAEGGPSAAPGKYRRGDDDGCFASALSSVIRWGGVLEHPEASAAWRAFGLAVPKHGEGWVRAGLFAPGWTCSIDQGWYGHAARKRTWLYAVSTDLPELCWESFEGGLRLDEGWHSTEERQAARAAGVAPTRRLGARERLATPEPFRDLLIDLARSARKETS